MNLKWWAKVLFDPFDYMVLMMSKRKYTRNKKPNGKYTQTSERKKVANVSFHNNMIIHFPIIRTFYMLFVHLIV